MVLKLAVALETQREEDVVHISISLLTEKNQMPSCFTVFRVEVAAVVAADPHGNIPISTVPKQFST